MRVAALLLGAMRGHDVVVRTGGEEFVLLMPRTDANAAASACERLRTAIRDEPWDQIAPGIGLTAGIRVATMGRAAPWARWPNSPTSVYTRPRARGATAWSPDGTAGSRV